MDGIDAVLIDFAEQQPRVLAVLTDPYPNTLRGALDEVRADPDGFPAARLARLHAEVGDAFSEAALNVLKAAGVNKSEVAAVGSHGQTVLHRPDDAVAHTLQIGDPARIAARTGIDVIADLRSADVAAGGQGAPLAPLLHAALLADADENRLILNLGGIANLTLLSASGATAGFDTGPASCYLDLWFRQHGTNSSDQSDRFDRDGAWARSGTVDAEWLNTLMDEPYLHRAAPKSTGIEYFDPRWLERRLPGDARSRPAGIQATLAEFTAASIALNIQHQVPFTPDRLLVCGGGVHNHDLLRRLQQQLGELPIASTAEFGIDPDAVEACLIAWLARAHTLNQPVDTRAITGARHPVVLGARWPASPQR